MYDLIVVGAGYWGTAIAFEAHRGGWNTLLLGDNQPLAASPNAAALIHEGVFQSAAVRRRWPSNWKGDELEASLCWLEEHCGLKKVGETFINAARPDLGARGRSDLYAMPNNDSLLDLYPRTLCRVSRFYRRRDSWVVWSDHGALETRKVVVAAGVWSGELLKASGLASPNIQSLEGQGLIFRSSTAPPFPPIALQWKPYRKYYARDWNGHWRVGDTAGQLKEEELLAAANYLAGEIVAADWVGGYRPTTEQFVVEELSPGLVLATGGYRVGLGLAGLVARRVIRWLRAE